MAGKNSTQGGEADPKQDELEISQKGVKAKIQNFFNFFKESGLIFINTAVILIVFYCFVFEYKNEKMDTSSLFIVRIIFAMGIVICIWLAFRSSQVYSSKLKGELLKSEFENEKLNARLKKERAKKHQKPSSN
jgi:hypothetical protein